MTPTLTTADGLQLHLHDWPRAAPRGTVLIVHGLGEHVGRYAPRRGAAERLGLARGRATTTAATAAAAARAARIAGDDACCATWRRDRRRARRARRGPLLLLGHSMGGLIAARFVAEGLQPRRRAWHRAVDALVLSSPALAAGMNALQKLLLAVLGPLAPNLAVGNGLKPAWISRDPAVVRGLRGRPAGARPHHAAAGALHRRRRRAGAPPARRAGACRRC